MNHQSVIWAAQRQAMVEQIRTLRARGEQTLVSSGAILDDALRAELHRPGSDQRGGVNIVVRPPATVVQHVAHLQGELQQLEPHQYYYPPADLHLTLLEICAGQPLDAMDALAERVVAQLPGALADLASIHLDAPIVGYDAHACALNFLPRDHQLMAVREHVTARLATAGVPLAARYPARSAHLTFVRYLEPLRTPADQWVASLRARASEPTLTWTINEVWVTWGATWYGRRARIHETGPFRMGS